MWQYMSHIWKATKKAITDKDFRFILQQEWDKYKTRIDVQFYNIYWCEDILMALRKVILTKSARATFTTSKTCISLLLIMPQSEEARQNIKNEYQRRVTAGKTVTMSDLKKAEKQPRLPPHKGRNY